jgi:hypothetical protein
MLGYTSKGAFPVLEGLGVCGTACKDMAKKYVIRVRDENGCVQVTDTIYIQEAVFQMTPLFMC